MYAEVAVVDTDFIRQMEISAEQFYQEALKQYVGIVARDGLSLIAVDIKDGSLKAQISAVDLASNPAPSNVTHPKLIARGHMFGIFKNSLFPDFKT